MQSCFLAVGRSISSCSSQNGGWLLWTKEKQLEACRHCYWSHYWCNSSNWHNCFLHWEDVQSCFLAVGRSISSCSSQNGGWLLWTKEKQLEACRHCYWGHYWCNSSNW